MSRRARPRLWIVGGPDVEKRLPLLEELRGELDCGAAGSRAELAPRFAERDFPYDAYRLSRRFDLLADARSFLELRRLLRARRPDLVHCFDTKPCALGRLAAAAAGVPVVIGTLPGLGGLYTYRTPSVRRRRAVYRRLHRWGSRVSAATVFQNRDDLELFVSGGVTPAGRAVLIPGSGVPEGPFTDGLPGRAAARRDLELDPDAEVVTMVARLVRAKGILDLVRAAERLRRDRPRLVVLLAGPRDAGTTDALDDAELASLEGRLRWLGERADVPRLLAASDVFAYPSYYREGLPRALVEAALAGVPMVAADAVGSHEVVEHEVTGLLVEPRRPDLLAAAIARVLGDAGLARRLAERARERARERFTLDRIAGLHRRLYRRLLAEAAA